MLSDSARPQATEVKALIVAVFEQKRKLIDWGRSGKEELDIIIVNTLCRGLSQANSTDIITELQRYTEKMRRLFSTFLRNNKIPVDNTRIFRPLDPEDGTVQVAIPFGQW